MGDLVATFVKPLHILCNLSAIVNYFSRGEVAGRSQAMWDRGFRQKVSSEKEIQYNMETITRDPSIYI